MAEFKLVVSDPKTKKSEVHEIKDAGTQILLGHKIGDIVDAAPLGLVGRIQITGGSDRAGFPMRSDVLGGGKNYVLLTKGVGFREREEGLKKRKLVRGNMVNEEIYQINAKKVEDSPQT